MAITLGSIATLFGRRTSQVLGVDLGSTTVRMVGLNKDSSGALSVDVCTSSRLRDGWIVSGNIENFDEVASALAQMVTNAGTRFKDVVMALPTASVITRRVKVPSGMAELDFETQIEVEVSPYLPWSLEDTMIDYHVLESVPNSGETDVLVAAARREMVEERVALVEAAGLNLVALDVEPFARTRAASRLVSDRAPNAAQGLVAIIEIGSLSTLLQVSKNHEIIYDRDLSFGGSHLTQLIERVYLLDPSEAERQKRFRELPPGYESKVVGPYIANVAAEIERELHIFHSKAGLARVSSILLSGGGACLPNFAKAVATQTGLPTTAANPFAGISLKSNAVRERLKSDRPAYLTAVGLALRGVVN